MSASARGGRPALVRLCVLASLVPRVALCATHAHPWPVGRYEGRVSRLVGWEDQSAGRGRQAARAPPPPRAGARLAASGSVGGCYLVSRLDADRRGDQRRPVRGPLRSSGTLGAAADPPTASSAATAGGAAAGGWVQNRCPPRVQHCSSPLTNNRCSSAPADFLTARNRLQGNEGADVWQPLLDTMGTEDVPPKASPLHPARLLPRSPS